MKLLKNKNILSEKIENKTILFDTERLLFFSLNSTGTLIWGLVNNVERQKLIKKFCNLVDTDGHLVKNEVNMFIDQLIKDKLIISK
jgi:hypothetical protein